MSNKYRKHQNLLKTFLIEAQKEFPKMRFFERHVGLFYTKQGTPVRINKPGMADVWAIQPSIHGLIHIEYEIKSSQAVQNKKQKDWQKFIEANNGLYLIVNDDYHIAIEKTGEFLSARGIL